MLFELRLRHEGGGGGGEGGPEVRLLGLFDVLEEIELRGGGATVGRKKDAGRGGRVKSGSAGEVQTLWRCGRWRFGRGV